MVHRGGALSFLY
ncbi:unnamed protein product, partial [Didymodactylos carnosus]